MTTKSPTDLAQDARTLADSLRERFNAGEFTLHRAATMLDTLAALITEQARILHGLAVVLGGSREGDRADAGLFGAGPVCALAGAVVLLWAVGAAAPAGGAGAGAAQCVLV